jgi:hypothetical protein
MRTVVSLWRSRHRQEGNININLKRKRMCGCDWAHSSVGSYEDGYETLHSLKGRAYFLPFHRGRSCFTSRLCSCKTLCKLTIKFPLKTVNSLGDRKLTTPTYIVYNYTTSGKTELYTIYLLYIRYIYISMQYTYISIQNIYLIVMQ